MWEISSVSQVASFLYAVATGSALSLFFDFFRALRKHKFYGKVSIFFQDIIFWIFSTFITFFLLMARSNGEIRGYILLGELAGFFLFRILLSRFVIIFLLFVLKMLNKIFNIYNGFIALTAAFLADIFKKVDNMLIKIKKSIL